MAQFNLKQRIQHGETVIGVRVPGTISKDDFKAAVDERSYDFAFIDGQHSALSEDRLVAFCEMADEFDIPVRFRIKHTRHAYLIGNYLDLGPSGIEVPQVEHEATVDEAIESFYYPPLGRRSFGGAGRKNVDKFDDPMEYGRWWNDYGMLWVQVESVAAVTKVYSLLKPGVDCIAFGPVDLTVDLQHHPHPQLKTMDDCVAFVAKAIAGTGTGICLRTTSDLQQKYADLGITVFLLAPGS
jgi:2-keto-3-deoxy-L-rhamnonate aldolase RhmA